MRKRFVTAFVLALMAASARAEAQPFKQGFALNRYEPSERGSEWFVMDTLDLRGKIRPAIGITGDWNYHPLVAYDINGKYLRPLVREQLGLTVEAFPLACVLEGGTWGAGRRLAREKRPDGGPPIAVTSDGTVF